MSEPSQLAFVNYLFITLDFFATLIFVFIFILSNRLIKKENTSGIFFACACGVCDYTEYIYLCK